MDISQAGTDGQVTHLDQIAPGMRESVRRFAAVVREALGHSLRGLSIFGAAVGERFDPTSGPAESVLVLENVDPVTLRRLAGHGTRLGKYNLAAPLVMTPAYIAASLDAFPLELLEVQQRHATVLGEDHFASIAFEAGAVRLQCERELKRVLAVLSQGILASRGSHRVVPLLEHDAGLILMRTLRGLLWLDGERDACPKDELVRKIEKRFDRKLQGMRSAVDSTARPDWRDFDELFRDVQALGEIANAW